MCDAFAQFVDQRLRLAILYKGCEWLRAEVASLRHHLAQRQANVQHLQMLVRTAESAKKKGVRVHPQGGESADEAALADNRKQLEALQLRLDARVSELRAREKELSRAHVARVAAEAEAIAPFAQRQERKNTSAPQPRKGAPHVAAGRPAPTAKPLHKGAAGRGRGRTASACTSSAAPAASAPVAERGRAVRRKGIALTAQGASRP